MMASPWLRLGTYGIRAWRPPRAAMLVLPFATLFAAACRPQPIEQRVLFIGNSYVFTHDLPGTFKALAAAKHHRVETGMAATGGWTLFQHAESPETRAAIAAQPWTTIVLQEQSVLPVFRTERERRMYPAVRELARLTRDHHATPALLSTWAHRDGLAGAGFPTFEGMQAELDEGYRAIAEDVGATIIPAGRAWAAARAQLPTLELWQADGSHPSPAGTYLAACVAFAAVFRESPVGSPALLGVDGETATLLQAIAARVVLTPSAP